MRKAMVGTPFLIIDFTLDGTKGFFLFEESSYRDHVEL